MNTIMKSAFETPPQDSSNDKLDILSHDEKLQALKYASAPFNAEFQKAPIDSKKHAVGNFFEALNNTYDVTYQKHGRNLSVQLYFDNNKEVKDWSFNSEIGYIQAPARTLEHSQSEDTIFSICHEYGHALMHAKGHNVNLLVATRFDHDTKADEIGATKFAFDIMDRIGIDKTQNQKLRKVAKSNRLRRYARPSRVDLRNRNSKPIPRYLSGRQRIRTSYE